MWGLFWRPVVHGVYTPVFFVYFIGRSGRIKRCILLKKRTIFDNFWQILTNFDKFWQILTNFVKIFDNFWQFLTIFDKFLTNFDKKPGSKTAKSPSSPENTPSVHTVYTRGAHGAHTGFVWEDMNVFYAVWAFFSGDTPSAHHVNQRIL